MMDISIDLNLLDHQKRIVFCLACCERLFPAYASFCSESSFGSPKYMRALLDNLWNAIEDMSISVTDLEDALAKLESLAPDTDEYSSVNAALALNFVAAVANTLEYIVNEDKDNLLSVPSQVTDAIDTYLMNSNDISPITETDELYVQNHPLYQREEARQVLDFDLLITTNILSRAIIQQIRDDSAYDVLTL